MSKTIQLTIDNSVLERYNKYYFSLHPKAHVPPIKQPRHESMNVWMIMKRPMMNALKQRWKDFIGWFVTEQGYANLRIEKCEIRQVVYYPTQRRADVDTSVGKFVLDGLVQAQMVIDDDYRHITKLILECGYDKDNPRTELYITVLDE